MDATPWPRREWLPLALHEYDALRAEVTGAMQTMQSSLAFGSASLGLVVVGVFELVKERPHAAAAVSIVGVPLVSGLAVSIWFGEFLRMMRAGWHLYALERHFKEATGAPTPVFEWEANLHKRDRSWYERQHCLPYYCVVASFAVIALASILFGVTREPAATDSIAAAVVLSLIVVVGALAVVFSIHQAANARDEIATTSAALAGSDTAERRVG